MKYPYCLPIIKSDKQEIIATIQQQKNTYPYFEVWLDYIDDLDTTFLEVLETDLSDRLIIVFRRQQLAPIQMSLAQRYELLNSLEGSSVLVDLDIDIQQSEIEYLKQTGNNLKTIISYHNYQNTPKDKELQSILPQIRKNNPSIIKVATKCQSEDDAVRLLDLLLSLKEEKQKYIILGMGQHGLITRIFGTLWGNELIFAPKKKSQQSAPGQLTKNELDNILQTIGE